MKINRKKAYGSPFAPLCPPLPPFPISVFSIIIFFGAKTGFFPSGVSEKNIGFVVR
jgi:hypothetical protein